MIQFARKAQQRERKIGRDRKVSNGLGVGERLTANRLKGSLRRCSAIPLSGERTTQFTYQKSLNGVLNG